jgi:hypothetical protein
MRLAVTWLRSHWCGVRRNIFPQASADAGGKSAAEPTATMYIARLWSTAAAASSSSTVPERVRAEKAGIGGGNASPPAPGGCGAPAADAAARLGGIVQQGSYKLNESVVLLSTSQYSGLNRDQYFWQQ